eukprot:TRINITY_DN10464_c0_g4_i1.p1 TRINITY_DN10464_c0_g4~~TRINITY_DN10464_c0_g4_i1.p1  ORF type:complete len:640 (+),score=111.01 TRINITY_DN10464_c0_g4_i1:63-1922(+)
MFGIQGGTFLPDDRVRIRDRHSCTDLPCCVIFAIVLAGFCGLYGYGVSHGNTGKLYHGIDYAGRVCGVDENVADKPYLYWCQGKDTGGILSGMSATKALGLDLKHPICVDFCPTKDKQHPGNLETECTTAGGNPVGYATKVQFHRYCFPDAAVSKEAEKQVEEMVKSDHAESLMRMLSSIPAAWDKLVGTFFVATILGYVYLLGLRSCAGCLVWTAIVTVIVGFAAMGAFLWSYKDSDAVLKGSDEYKAYQVGSIISFVFCAIAVCITCCAASSVRTATGVIEVACDAMFALPSLLIAPISKALLKGGFAVVLLYGFLALLSTCEISTEADGLASKAAGGAIASQAEGVVRHFKFTSQDKYMLLGYLFVSYWLEYFINALYQFVIAFAMAEYYYSPVDEYGNKEDLGCPLWTGTYIGLFFHCGSLAFGSFVIACFALAQTILAILEAQNKEGGDNPVVTCVLSTLQSIIYCLQKIVEFINKNAWIDMAITSNSYCMAAKEAIGLIVEMAGAMAILNGATLVFSVMGAMLIALASGAFAFFITPKDTVDDPMVVAIAGGLIGASVAACFMLVLDMSTDALLFCYGLDMRDGHPSPHAPPALRDLYGYHEKKANGIESDSD